MFQIQRRLGFRQQSPPPSAARGSLPAAAAAPRQHSTRAAVLSRSPALAPSAALLFHHPAAPSAHTTTPSSRTTEPPRGCSQRVSLCTNVLLRTRLSSRPDALATSSTSRAGHVRVGVLDPQDDGSSSTTTSGGSNGELWGSTSHSGAKQQQQWLRTPNEDTARDSEADHSANQITLFLSLSVTLITLPWLYHHPETLLVPLALLVMPMPGSALRPALLEGLIMIASAARWMVGSHGGPPASSQNHNSSPGSAPFASHQPHQDRQQQQQQQQQQQAGSWSSSPQASQHQQPGAASSYPPHPRSAAFHAGASPPDADGFSASPMQMQHPSPSHAPHYAAPLHSDHQEASRPYPPHQEAYQPYEEYAPGPAPSPQPWAFSVDRAHGQQEAVMDVDWPAGAGEGGSSGGGGGGGGGGGDSWHRNVLQNLNDTSAPAFAYYSHASHEPSPPPLGPYSAWPQPNTHPSSYAQPQPPVPHQTDPSLPSMHASSLPPPQHPHQRLQSKDSPPALPLASAERYHDSGYQQQQQQQQQQPRSSGNGQSEPGFGRQSGSPWHSVLFSVAPWMKSWGGFL